MISHVLGSRSDLRRDSSCIMGYRATSSGEGRRDVNGRIVWTPLSSSNAALLGRLESVHRRSEHGMIKFELEVTDQKYSLGPGCLRWSLATSRIHHLSCQLENERDVRGKKKQGTVPDSKTRQIFLEGYFH